MKRLAQTLILGVVTGLAFFQPLVSVDTFFGESREQSIAYAQSAWSSTTTYFLDDTVTHAGSTWVSFVNSNIGNEPGTSSAWELVPATGGTGTTPATGGATTTPPATGGIAPEGGTTPPSSAEGASNNPDEIYSNNFSGYECDLLEGKIQGCIVEILYYFVFVPLQMITYIAAKFLDFFIAYSINSESYRGVQFIEQGWTIVRDLTNIAFIFALLYIAFNYILDKAAVAKKLLISVIVVGLAINFSLFITRVIVDAGNVLAHVFYNQINVTVGTAIDPATSDFNEKPISAAVVSQSNPQQILLRIQAGGFAQTSTAVMAIIAASAFSVLLISIFASMAFLFVGRTVSLMIQMIFAPLAFASKIIPGIPLEQFQLNRWFSETLRLSFLAPVFIFFLYLVVLFLDAAQRVAYPTNGDIITTIIQVLLPFALSYFILKKGVDITKKLAGEAAVMISDTLNKATSWATTAALGAATGGTAMALRGTAGRLGSKIAQETAGKTDTASRLANRFANKAASSTFDFRASRLGKFAQDKTGIKLGNVPESAKGGWEGSQQRYIETQKKKADEFAKIRDDEFWNKNIKNKEQAIQDIKNRKQGEDDKAYDAAVKALGDARKEFEQAKKDGKTKSELDEIKEKIAAEKDKIRATTKYADIKKAQEELKDAKKAKEKEGDRRREAYISDIMPKGIAYQNPLATSDATITEAKRNIRGTKEDDFENLGDKINKDQVEANAQKRKEQRDKEEEKSKNKNKNQNNKKQGDYGRGPNNSAQNPPQQPNPAQQETQNTTRPQGTVQRQDTRVENVQNAYTTVFAQPASTTPAPTRPAAPTPAREGGNAQQTNQNNSYNQSPNVPSEPATGQGPNTQR